MSHRVSQHSITIVIPWTGNLYFILPLTQRRKRMFMSSGVLSLNLLPLLRHNTVEPIGTCGPYAHPITFPRFCKNSAATTHTLTILSREKRNIAKSHPTSDTTCTSNATMACHRACSTFVEHVLGRCNTGSPTLQSRPLRHCLVAGVPTQGHAHPTATQECIIYQVQMTPRWKPAFTDPVSDDAHILHLHRLVTQRGGPIQYQVCKGHRLVIDVAGPFSTMHARVQPK